MECGIYPWVVLIAMAAALAAGPILIRLAPRLGLIDRPVPLPHKLHTQPMPLVGGTALVVALGLAWLLVLPAPSRPMTGILLATALVYVLGAWDDRAVLPARVKFLGQGLAAGVLWLFGVSAHFFGRGWLDFGLSLVWVVGVLNAVNFMDSMDGLALGLGAIASAFFALAALNSGQAELAALCLALLGATLGTVFYNLSPARLFLGDSGAEVLGLLLAAAGMAYDPPRREAATWWFVPVLFLGVAIWNMSLVVFSRLRRRVPVLRAQRDQSVHRLMDLGLSPSRTVLLMHLTAIVLSLTGLIAAGWPPGPANWTVAAVIAVGFASIALLERYAPAGWASESGQSATRE
ncbi:MAG: MraY family glycosyltransferase [Chloroflexota bacterium]